MRHSPLFAIVTILGALSSGACGHAARSIDDGGDNDSSDALSENRVTWDKDGNIDRRWGINGNWWAFNDCEGRETAPAGLLCTKPDESLVGPDGARGWSTSAKRVCMKGIAPRVELGPDMTPAFDFQWGAGIAINLAYGEPGTYDADAHGIVGFMFDVTQGTPGRPTPPTLQLSLDTASTADDEQYFLMILIPSVDQPVIFSKPEDGSVAPRGLVEQPEWVMAPRPFTSNAITSMVFQVYTNEQAEKPYDFCVSNFRVLCDGPCIP